MIPHPVYRSARTLGPLAGVVLAFATSCAYSNSETPRPLEPDLERVAQERAPRAAAKPDAANPESEAAPELLEEDPRAPSTTPAESWGQ